MADKIMEIMESGHLRKLDHIGEEVPVVKMFTNIWGTDVVSSGKTVIRGIVVQRLS